jgi:transglutaminase-like putative cysteine protease
VTGKTGSIWTIAVLVALGIASLVVRQNLNLEASDNDFLLKYKVDFNARKPDARTPVVNPDIRVLASIPVETRTCKIVRHDFDGADVEEVRYRIHTAESRKNFVLRALRTGPITCNVWFRLRLDPNGAWSVAQPPLTPRDRSGYLSNAKGITVKSDAAMQVVNRLHDGKPSNQELVRRIFNDCRTNIESVGAVGDDSGDIALKQQKGSPSGRARAMILLCRSAGIPARLVVGFEIKKADRAQPRTWVEVYASDRWEPYDLEDGHARELPYNFVPVLHEGIDPVRVTNSTNVNRTYSIDNAPPAIRTALSILDLHNLPDKLKEPIKVVLILPIGALLTAFVRTIIGIRTFGTFSPTLLALAFVYNDFNTGLCIFAVVIATGFISRGVLDRLKLLLVPRLSIILTLVVMLMVLGVSIMNYFKELAPNPGQTVLLPMVILTNLVERFYVTSEEDSFVYAVRLMTTTLLMALVIYLLLSWRVLGNVLFDNPELHFFTVAILIVMGRYTGYRLTELVRFRDLVQPPKE